MISNNLYSDIMVVTDEELIGKKMIFLGKFVRKCVFAFISRIFFGRAVHFLDFFRPGRAISRIFFGRGGPFLGFFSPGEVHFLDFFRPGRAISKLFFSRAGHSLDF